MGANRQPGYIRLGAQSLWLDFQEKAFFMVTRRTESGWQIYRQSRGNAAFRLYSLITSSAWFMAAILHPHNFKKSAWTKRRRFKTATIEGYWRTPTNPVERHWAETWRAPTE